MIAEEWKKSSNGEGSGDNFFDKKADNLKKYIDGGGKIIYI